MFGLRDGVAQPPRIRATAAAIDEGPCQPELVNSEIVEPKTLRWILMPCHPAFNCLECGWV